MPNLTIDAGLFGKSAGDALTYNFADIGFSDAGRGSISDTYGTDLGVVWGELYYEFGVDYVMEFGLTGTAQLDLGGISGALDYTQVVDVTKRRDLDGVVGATLDLSGSTVDLSGFEITAPDPANSFVSVDLLAKLDANFFGKVGYHVDSVFGGDDGETSFDIDVVDIDIDQEIARISAQDLAGNDATLFKFELLFGELSVGLPVLEFEEATAEDESDPLGALVTTAVSEPFLTFEVDLDSFLLPVGNSFDWSVDMGPFSAAIDVGVIDAKVTASAALEQTVSWDPAIDVSLTTEFGEVLTGELGDVFTFETPEGQGSFLVTVTYLPSVTVATTTSLVLATSLDWKMLYGEATLGIDFDIWQDEYVLADFALAGGSEPLAEPIVIELTTSTDLYTLEAVTETHRVFYEKFVTAASGKDLYMTRHQVELVAGALDNLAVGNLLNNVIHGEAGDDTIRGDEGDDQLFGDEGDDVIEGGRGDDAIDGGLGKDTVSYARAAGAVAVDLARGIATGAGSDTLAGIEIVAGSRFADTLAGDGTGTRLSGGAGADTLIGGLLANGRPGGDVADYRKSREAVTVDLGAGTGAGGDAEGDRLSGIRHVTGTRRADTLIGDDTANVLAGGGGTDTLMGMAGNDRLTIDGGVALVDGGEGNDTLVVRGGDLTFTDANFRSIETVLVHGAATIDLTEIGGPVAVTIRNEDVEYARVVGSAGADTFRAETRKYSVYAGAGDDTLYTDTHAAFAGAEGFDTVVFQEGGTITFNVADVEKVVLTKTATVDFTELAAPAGLVVEAVGGFVTGTRGNDAVTLSGTAGAWIDGGLGNDTITLGAGDDLILVGDKNFGKDVVIGFDRANDRISFVDAGIAQTSTWYTRNDDGDGTVLHYYGFDRGQDVTGSIELVGVDYNYVMFDGGITVLWG